MYLSKKTEKQLKALLELDRIKGVIIRGDIIQSLVEQGYVKGKKCSDLSDLEPRYMLFEITDKGYSYFTNKRRDTRRYLISSIITVMMLVATIVGILVSL